MSTTDIMTACFDHLDTFISVPQPAILWPGLQTEPPDADIWLQPGFFPNENVDRAWDNDACVETRGFFQILVYYRVRPDVGLIEPSRVADALIEHFPKGTVLSAVRVRKRPWQSPAITEDASRAYIPVTVPYMGLT